MNQEERRRFLIEKLLRERLSCRRQEIPADTDRQKVLLRSLMNVRHPGAIRNMGSQISTPADFIRLTHWRNTGPGGAVIFSITAIHRAKEEFELPEYQELLKELGVDGEWEGIGHCAVGYVDGEIPKAAKRKDNRVFWVD